MKPWGLELTCVDGPWNAFKLKGNEQYSMESPFAVGHV